MRLRLRPRQPAQDSPSVYQHARGAAGTLWDLLDGYTAPGDREWAYRELASAYRMMAGDGSGVSAEHDADLAASAVLCEALALTEQDPPRLLVLELLGVSALSPPLAGAWQQLNLSRDRAERARLLSGTVIPLTAPHVTRGVLALLHHVAGCEAALAEPAEEARR